MLYRPNSERAGMAEDYAAEYTRRHPNRRIELINIDTPDGAHKASVYGITNHPAILALADNGSLLQLWQDEHLPLSNEIDFYLSA